MTETAARSTVSIEELTEIPVQLPPILMTMIGYPAHARYVALYYMGKATYDDGRNLATFSYYSVFEPLINHPALALELLDANLGSDDEPPTHALLCDRETRKFYVGEYRKVLTLCYGQHGAEPGAAAAEDDESGALPDVLRAASSAEFHRAGVFELFTRPDARAQRETAALLAWLDDCLTEELVRALIDKFNGGDLRLWPQMEYLRRLIARARAQRGAGDEPGAAGDEAQAV